MLGGLATCHREQIPFALSNQGSTVTCNEPVTNMTPHASLLGGHHGTNNNVGAILNTWSLGESAPQFALGSVCGLISTYVIRTVHAGYKIT